MDNRENKTLIDRIEYFMKYPEDEYSLCIMFTEEERNILTTIQKYEQIRYAMVLENKENSSTEEDLTEEIFRKREREKDICFLLKEQISAQIDVLLKKGQAGAWLDILTWYQLLKGKDLITDKFWEFPILGIMLKAFKEESEQHYSSGSRISVLSFRSIKELTDSYFDIVFMLRRIEYDVEPIDEILYYLPERKISLTVVQVILENARIFDKEKVKKTIDGWLGKRMSGENISLINKIKYYMDHPEDEKYFITMFTEEERNILRKIQDFERNRYVVRLEKICSSESIVVAKEILRKMEKDKEISFSLKKQIAAYMDSLLGQGKIKAWTEILAWYRFLDNKNIIVNEFWEFPVLGTILKAFTEELKLFYNSGEPLSVLSIHNMEELIETYFSIVFLLRRIEYEIEPIDEVLHELTERQISKTTIKVILWDARISHREKVEKSIAGWSGSRNG